jgi:glyoxylase-like metal-dependent hydrolase (beta-lactamase superfamily II)
MALALWLAFETCAFSQPSPAKPEAKSFKLGALEVSVLHDDSLAIPNDGSIFGLNAGGAAAVAKVLSEAGAPTNKVQLDVDALLIRMPGHLVLVDAGYGPSGHGIVQSSLALTGVSPADITDILVTHAHPDHVGGLVDAQGRSAFPKATIRMSAKEWAFMQREDGVRAEVPIIRAQVKTFQPGRPILTGVTPLALPGHTPGHVGYEIASQGHKLIDIGDVAHSSIVSLAKPRWTIAWDSNKQEGVQTRRQELRRLADTHELMFAPHFPFPGVGRIEKAGDGYRFQPEMPSSK